MEADWSEISRIAFPGSSPSASPGQATALAFDSVQELLWAGNEYVRQTKSYLTLDIEFPNVLLTCKTGPRDFFLRD